MFFRDSEAKREAGESPARTRHCKNGVSSIMSLKDFGKAEEMLKFKSGDLHDNYPELTR